jgi:hypothetical protein
VCEPVACTGCRWGFLCMLVGDAIDRGVLAAVVCRHATPRRVQPQLRGVMARGGMLAWRAGAPARISWREGEGEMMMHACVVRRH